MKMPPQLKKSLRPLFDDVYQEYCKEKGGTDLARAIVAERYYARICAQGADMDEIVKEFARQWTESAFRVKRKSINLKALWLGGIEWAVTELKSGLTAIGAGKDSTNYMLTWEHLEIRAANQADHIIGAEAELAKTKEVMESDAGRMVKETPGFVLGDAVVALMTAAAKTTGQDGHDLR